MRLEEETKVYGCLLLLLYPSPVAISILLFHTVLCFYGVLAYVVSPMNRVIVALFLIIFKQCLVCSISLSIA